MARTSLVEDLVKISSEVPWWIATAVGGGMFYLLKYYLPAQVAENQFSEILAPVYSVVAYMFLGACLFGALIGQIKRWRERRIYNRQKSVNTVRSLSWSDFERFIVEAFRRQGFRANRTANGADGGIDVVLEKDGNTSVVQCKQWKNSRVGVKPIRELAGVVSARKATRGIFVCSGDYTTDARRFAAESGIELIGGQSLAELLDLDESHRQHVPTGTDFAEDCPKCGSTLVRRVARKGKNTGSAFWGCGSFPKCRYTRNL